ncbi:uncharacterized [Tachysurus ichikawai]
MDCFLQMKASLKLHFPVKTYHWQRYINPAVWSRETHRIVKRNRQKMKKANRWEVRMTDRLEEKSPDLVVCHSLRLGDELRTAHFAVGVSEKALFHFC